MVFYTRQPAPLLSEYREALGVLEAHAHIALKQGQMNRHMVYGRAFHSLADAALERYGVELRPQS